MQMIKKMKAAVHGAVGSTETLGRRLQQSTLVQSSVGQLCVDMLLLPSDAHRILRQYKARFHEYPDLVRPATFNEFLQQTKLTRRSRELVVLADKIRVREHVARVIGEQYLTRVYWTGTDLRTVDREALPSSFMLKANHGSNFNLPVPVAEALDWDAAVRTADRWLATDQSARFSEWHYRWIPRSLLIEELLLTPGGGLPDDYKFFCFHGEARLCQVDIDRATRHTRNFYDRQFRPVPMTFEYPSHEGPVSKPACFDDMVALAERLAGRHPFVRVDFYDVRGPVFGELTFHPGAGLNRFGQDDWNRRLGTWALGRGA